MPTGDSENVLLTLNEMKWVAGPPILPAGVKIMVIKGNPREAGPFTMRLWFPAGTRVAPHCHPGVEHATVISGSAHWGMGQKFESNKLRAMPAGSFIMICAGSPHFGQITEDTVIQAHGIGPWRTIYVNPADDPAASTTGRWMAKPKPERKPAATTPTPSRVLPMELQLGDRIVDTTGEYEVIGRSYTTAAGKTAHVRVKRVDRPSECAGPSYV